MTQAAILPSHRLRNIRPDKRRATCDRCGEVGIKSAGSEGPGRTRWRCAQQVNEYRRSKAAKVREAANSRYATAIIWPCCGATDKLEPPDEVDVYGDAEAKYELATCPGCGTIRSIDVMWVDDPIDGFRTIVNYKQEQVYVDGRLDTEDWPAA